MGDGTIEGFPTPQSDPVPIPLPDPLPEPSAPPTNPCDDDDDDDRRNFAHGTSRESAQDIVTNGINEIPARANSSRGRNIPGSFHTFDVDRQIDAIQLAYEAGFTKVPDPVVVIMSIPESTFDDLVTSGQVLIQPIAESGATETVFRPSSFDTLNSVATFPAIIDPNLQQ